MDAVGWAHIALCQPAGLKASRQAAASVPKEVSGSGALLQEPSESCSLHFFLFLRFSIRSSPMTQGRSRAVLGLSCCSIVTVSASPSPSRGLLGCFLFSSEPDQDAALASAQLEQAGTAMLCGPAARPAGSSGLALLPLHLLLSRALLLRLEGSEGREGWVSQGLQAVKMLSLPVPKRCNLVCDLHALLRAQGLSLV